MIPEPVPSVEPVSQMDEQACPTGENPVSQDSEKPAIGKQDSLEASEPFAEAGSSKPEAFHEPISANGKQNLSLPPDLGLVLLGPGSRATVPSVSRPVIPVSQSPESAPNPEPKSEPESAPWLVELQQACRSAAEQGIRDAMAQMAAQSKESGTTEKTAEPIPPITVDADGEIRQRDRGPVNPNRFVVK